MLEPEPAPHLVPRTGLFAIVAAAGVWFAFLFWPKGQEPPRLVPSAVFDEGRLALSFSEEFSGSTLDRGSWRTAYSPDHVGSPTVAKRSLWSNRERQVYFDREFLDLGIDPFQVCGGTLTITARPLTPMARARVLNALAEQPADIRDSALRQVSYSSGLLTTRSTFAQRHGYFEVRARWSGGKGLWPAFWLLPADGSWPPEVNVMEAHGDEPKTIFQSKLSKVEPTVTRRVPVGGNVRDFHRYGVLWTPKRLTFYIDGRKTASMTTPNDLDKPMYLLANLAVGGSWPGDPDLATPFPATMEIDYIRAWMLTD